MTHCISNAVAHHIAPLALSFHITEPFLFTCKIGNPEEFSIQGSSPKTYNRTYKIHGETMTWSSHFLWVRHHRFAGNKLSLCNSNISLLHYMPLNGGEKKLLLLLFLNTHIDSSKPTSKIYSVDTHTGECVQWCMNQFIIFTQWSGQRKLLICYSKWMSSS